MGAGGSGLVSGAFHHDVMKLTEFVVEFVRPNAAQIVWSLVALGFAIAWLCLPWGRRR